MRLHVYVQDQRGEPLIPTTPRKAKRMVNDGHARVVYRTPFTIQLMRATGETRQPCTLEGDWGSHRTDYSVHTDDNRELLAVQLEHRTDVSDNIATRAMYRTGRRYHLWYRETRFDNRASPEGWLPPSTCQKLGVEKRMIAFIKTILPITRVIGEVATFDAHRMKNPEISGVEYQQGELHGYEVREYLLEKWQRKCAYCGTSGVPLQVEHVIPQHPRKGEPKGTNRVDNLTLSCDACNRAKDNFQPADWLRRLETSSRAIDTQRARGLRHVMTRLTESLKSAPYMNMIRTRLAEHVNANITFGYKTKYHRLQEGLPKSHVNDAFIIAGGTKTAHRSFIFTVKSVRRNNRSLQLNRKGFAPSVRRQRYSLQPNALVRSTKNGRTYRIKGMFNRGTWVRLRDVCTNETVNHSITHVHLITHGKGLS